ncbi:MAG TPA: RagB/SusD family nutrient uptake outer membrane protein, partial [Bacteroidales bacterium]|nr:RagB/SusD family nutrient uptake outer membrane protein [Bacteroidales bacterium]
MKKILIYLTVLLSFANCEDYLDRKNLDTFDDSNFWSSEGNMRLFAQGAYTAYFKGYGNGDSWGYFFTGGAWSDEYSSSAIWTQTTATKDNGWSFTYVRRANLMIARVEDMPVSDEAKNHWRGIGRFFRALEYSDLTT